MSHAPESTFAERLEYVYWVRAMTHPGADDSDQSVADRGGLSLSWVRKWKPRSTAPTNHTLLRKLGAALEVDWEWLAGTGGDAPESQIWESWLTARRRSAEAPGKRAPTAAEALAGAEDMQTVLSSVPARKKRAR